MVEESSPFQWPLDPRKWAIHVVRTQGIEFKLRIKLDQQNLTILVCAVISQEIDKSKFIIGFLRLQLFRGSVWKAL